MWCEKVTDSWINSKVMFVMQLVLSMALISIILMHITNFSVISVRNIPFLLMAALFLFMYCSWYIGSTNDITNPCFLSLLEGWNDCDHRIVWEGTNNHITSSGWVTIAYSYSLFVFSSCLICRWIRDSFWLVECYSSSWFIYMHGRNRILHWL